MEMHGALLALCEGNPPATGGLPTQMASYAWDVDVIFVASLDLLDHLIEEATGVGGHLY